MPSSETLARRVGLKIRARRMLNCASAYSVAYQPGLPTVGTAIPPLAPNVKFTRLGAAATICAVSANTSVLFSMIASHAPLFPTTRATSPAWNTWMTGLADYGRLRAFTAATRTVVSWGSPVTRPRLFGSPGSCTFARGTTRVPPLPSGSVAVGAARLS